MSVDINWETLTGGPDGEALSEIIRQFIHDRFQQVDFPKLIRSVAVHSFDFGTVPPEITLKDVCDPLPDFYEAQDESAEQTEAVQEDAGAISNLTHQNAHPPGRHIRSKGDLRRPSELELLDPATTPTLARGAMLGSTSNFSYFHIHGFSGSNTPLAAVAGAHFQNAPSQSEDRFDPDKSFGSVSTASTASPPSRPVSREHSYIDERRASAILDGAVGDPTARSEPPPEVEPNPEDMQVVFHVTYAGDVKLSMTAEVFLDYPMPSFVGIPLKLNITGLTFNGVGILAYIKHRAHLCFLSPEDAEALVGREGATAAISADEAGRRTELSSVGALLEDIKIESEMGESSEGGQVLKNVGKIEKFILEQVQQIFEEEFVYPSFWTFLI